MMKQKYRTRETTRATNAWLVCLCLLVGCSGGDQKAEFVIPDTLNQEQITWERQPYLSEKEEALLERTIKLNPGIAEFEELEGERFSYLSDSGRQRYYWVLFQSEVVDWFYLEFQENELIEMKSGSGKPFIVSSSQQAEHSS